MARVALKVQELENRNEFAVPAATTALCTAVDTTDGAEFVMRERDDKYLLLIQNTGSAARSVTIKHGNGIQGVVDLVLPSLAAGNYTFLSIDSGRFKNVSGEDKGKVIITGSAADIKVAVFRLP